MMVFAVIINLLPTSPLSWDAIFSKLLYFGRSFTTAAVRDIFGAGRALKSVVAEIVAILPLDEEGEAPRTS